MGSLFDATTHMYIGADLLWAEISLTASSRNKLVL